MHGRPNRRKEAAFSDFSVVGWIHIVRRKAITEPYN